MSDIEKAIMLARQGDYPGARLTPLLAQEIDRLRRIIDSRPAINAGLPGTYIEWSQKVAALDFIADEVRQ